VNFEEYLLSKKIDSAAFKTAETSLYQDWQREFEVMNPASFTAQKLYLINPIRRKYQLKQDTKPGIPPVVAEKEKLEKELREPGSTMPTPEQETRKTEGEKAAEPSESAAPKKPVMAKPVFRPKPKMN
jgi:hypothetical protein